MKKFEIGPTSLLLDPHTKIEDLCILDRYVLDSTRASDNLQQFLDLRKEGDELKSWSWNGGPLCGRGGLCIVRDGKPIYAYATWMS